MAVWFQIGQDGVPISAGSPVGCSEETGRRVCEAEGSRGGGGGASTCTDARLATPPLLPPPFALVSPADRFDPNAVAIDRVCVPSSGDAEFDVVAAPPTRRTVTSPPAVEVGRFRRIPPFFPSLAGDASGGGAPHSLETEL